MARLRFPLLLSFPYFMLTILKSKEHVLYGGSRRGSRGQDIRLLLFGKERVESGHEDVGGFDRY